MMGLGRVLQCIYEEEELPGDPPEEMRQALVSRFGEEGLKFYIRSMREAVRLTKHNIVERVKERWEGR